MGFTRICKAKEWHCLAPILRDFEQAIKLKRVYTFKRVEKKNNSEKWRHVYHILNPTRVKDTRGPIHL